MARQKPTLNDLPIFPNNLIVNPGFELNQRNLASSAVNSTFPVDMWRMYVATSSATCSIDGSIVDVRSRFSFKGVYTHVAAGYLIIEQVTEMGVVLRGQQVTFSVRVRSSVAGSVFLSILDGVTQTNSAVNVGTGAFETLSVTATIGAATTILNLRIIAQTVSCTFYVDNAVLNLGPVAAEYQPLHQQDDMSRCQRYYEAQGYYTEFRGYQVAGSASVWPYRFRQWKAVSPTVTRAGTWSVTNCGQPAPDLITNDGCRLFLTATATGMMAAATDSADDAIVVEANP